MTTGPPGAENARAQERRLDALYAAHGRSVLAYAVRRAADEHDAADVLAETFLVAWRRLDDIPSGDQALMWLYAVARRILANQQRSERRRKRLAERLGHELVGALQAVAPPEPAAVPILAALAGLDPNDREVVLLAAWEELSPKQIGAVLGISQIAARSRLHRARKRLRALLDHPALVDEVDQLNIQEAI
jgi:RNA polymerase sigma-70 factor (ECF subfamily)